MLLAGDRNGRETVGNSTGASVGPGADLEEWWVALSDTRARSSKGVVMAVEEPVLREVSGYLFLSKANPTCDRRQMSRSVTCC